MMNVRRFQFTGVWVMALGATAAIAAPITLPTTAIYDSPTTSNAVDFNATGNSLGSLGGNDVAGFTTAVAAAFALNRGGVVDFEPSDGTPTAINATYGLGQGKTLPITFSTSSMKIQSFSSSKVISGNKGIYTGSESSASFSFNFGAILNGVPNEAVGRAGLTILGRTGYDSSTPSFTITAKFSDNTTAALSSSQPKVTTTGNGDTFYGFTAPAGLSIKSLTVSMAPTQAKTVLMDDLAFITIPEPASTGVIGLASLALLARRRWR